MNVRNGAGPGSRGADGQPPSFVEGSRAFHGVHGLVDVLAVVGAQRLIRVPARRRISEIAVLAVHVDELLPVPAARGGPAVPDA